MPRKGLDIVEWERIFACVVWDDLRVSASGKAQVFPEVARARVFDHWVDISFEQVVLAWRTDLAGRDA
ncbi:MAG TPA: hypothetical protein VNV87_05265 [Acidimicrobiales bacterium]|nr:hypothetical protein [Acidimicrobiales bacterium]